MGVRLIGLAGLVALASAFAPACYSAGNGTAPPPDSFYFPVGLAVSTGGNVLYVANSDFDLQWNGGTLQSYDLHQIRRDAAQTVLDPSNPNLPLVYPPVQAPYSCPNHPPIFQPSGTGARQPLGQTCAPQINSQVYVRDSAIIGAFATDLQLSACTTTPSFLTPPSGTPCTPVQPGDVQRLFSPVRGDTSLTWAAVVADNPAVPPPLPLEAGTGGSMGELAAPYAPFALACGTRVANRCASSNQAGTNPMAAGDNRFLTTPGEPFGIAQSEDGTQAVLTHQDETQSSLFSTGMNITGNPGMTVTGNPTTVPALQFILDGVDNGGNGIAAVPHDPDAFPPCTAPSTTPCQTAPRPAFLQTSRDVAKIDLLRFYSDQDNNNSSSYLRPFLTFEKSFPITVNASGTDSRGIAIDPTPRIACKASIPKGDPDYAAKIVACARKPARVFIANRAPETLLLGQVGGPSPADSNTYDADALSIFGHVPLLLGPSRVYLAPIVDSNGNYALRVFLVCFDSNTVYVYDPNAQAIEAIISVGLGPFAMAFDPFTLEDVALNTPVPPDPRDPDPTLGLKTYRFAYIASFTQSYVQVIDLDNSRANKSTFEQVVFTLGSPQFPKGNETSQ